MKQIPEETIEETDKPEVLKVLPGQKKLDSWGTVSPVKCRVPTGNGASANGDMDCQPSGSGTGKKEPSVSHMKQLLFDANGKLCLTEKGSLVLHLIESQNGDIDGHISIMTYSLALPYECILCS